MSKVEVISLVGQNGKSFGKYVDYGDFCKMQNEYETQIEHLKKQGEILLDRTLTLQKTCGRLTDEIEKLKCCGNCKHYNYCPMQTNKECQRSSNTLPYKWELTDERT